jgi:electron transfer flavoprotein alpha subunit
MSGVLVLADSFGGELRPSTLELIGAARAICAQGAGPLAVALIGPDAEAHAEAVNVAGVEEVVLVPTPGERFEAHVYAAALEQLVVARQPAVVLAAHTLDCLAFAPAVAARARLGFASDVTAVGWGESGPVARRPAYGGRLIAELDFPAKDTVLLLVRPGAHEPAVALATSGGVHATEPDRPVASVTRLALDLAGRSPTERVELRQTPAGDTDITKAELVLAIGRGVGVSDGAAIADLEWLARSMGATLAVSGPLVEAGLAPRTRKVGQSGQSVAPRVYLALGISGAPQHLAGVSGSSTIIAVNSDPHARIFDLATHGAVADLFEVAAELERQLA